MAQAKKKGAFFRDYFREIDAPHSLQIVPQGREWVLSVPKGEVKPARVVLYLGCNVLRTAHLVQTVVDIFKLLDVDFVAVGGASYCCGIQHFQNGEDKAAHSIAATKVRNFQKFQPERVVMWCPSERLSMVTGVNFLDQGTDSRLGRHCTDRVREQLGPGA